MVLLTKLPVGFVDGLEKVCKAGRFVHGPKAREAVTQQIYIALG